MLVDHVKLIIKAGNGGNGAATFLRNSLTAKGGPDGGNGGNGGDIYFQGTSNIRDLSQFRFKKNIKAEDGISGKRKRLFGKNAEHTTILVPLGTEITDTNSGRTYEVFNNIPLLLAKGGRGGRGNDEFKSATNQAPKYAELGGEGEEKKLLLSLRLIADIGLIGLPNAGKSSLLAVLTHATPKIGDYPFTTLEPNIGMLEKHPIADIPGLIEGAASGHGLGIGFLKHIEKTQILVHCIDVTSQDVEKVYAIVRGELEKHNPRLLEKPEIILLTKSDLVDRKTLDRSLMTFRKAGKKAYDCSVYDRESIKSLAGMLKDLLDKSV